MVIFDIDSTVDETSRAEEAKGKLGKQDAEDKLMNSVMASDKKTLDQAELVQEATNRNVGAFTPDLLYANMVKNFSMTRQLLGDKLIRMLSGYDPNYIEKNLKIPEFRKELHSRLKETIDALKQDGLVNDDGALTARATELGTFVLIKELDTFIAKDTMGDKVNKRARHYGEKAAVRPHRKGDRYKDINIRKSVHLAIRRAHQTLHPSDLITSEREGKGKVSLIIALDSSASMKGKKIETCKRAGVALAYKAIQEKDDVGLVVFGSEIKAAIPPTRDFRTLVQAISAVKALRQTDFAAMISKSIELFPPTSETKHLLILTDALPTVGKEPERETLKFVCAARAAGITVSLIGIQLDKEGRILAERITQLGEGRLCLVKDLGDVGSLVLEDYYSVR